MAREGLWLMDLFPTSGAVTVYATPTSDGVTVQARKTRIDYVKQAYTKAFGSFDIHSWDPSLGYATSRPLLMQLQDYYANLYLADPERLLWAGFAKIAGALTIGGLDLYVNEVGDDWLAWRIVLAAKDTFHDIAWQHEAFLDGTDAVLRLARERDQNKPMPPQPYAPAWLQIASEDGRAIEAGNRTLFENEQASIVQPSYMKSLAWVASDHVMIDNDPKAGLVEIRGLWSRWVSTPTDRRTNLVNLATDTVLQQGSPHPDFEYVFTLASDADGATG
jgi:hypothetical protein